MSFEFLSPTRIIFGEGKRSEIAPAACHLGRRIFLVTGRSVERVEFLKRNLELRGAACDVFKSSGEPTVALVERGRDCARSFKADVVVAVGGGSAIDCGKAIAALCTNSGETSRYLEVVGEGKPLECEPLPFIAVPTTAGTGTEVTRNAVLGVPEHAVKVSLRGAFMFPKIAVVDPELTRDLPHLVMAATGMDALTQLIEAFTSTRSNPFTDALCSEALPRVCPSLRNLLNGIETKRARHDLSLAALFSGIALANSGLGAVHGFAAAIGGMYSAPHGAICAALLPHVIETNYRAARLGGTHSAAIQRYDLIAKHLTGQPSSNGDHLAATIRELCADLQIPPLAHWGIERDAIGSICEKAKKANSMKTNPVPLNDHDLAAIVSEAL